MTNFLKIAGVAALVALASACASSNGPAIDATSNADTSRSAGPGAVVPGSIEDFEKNAGHRVFFGYDQYTLTPDARDVLARQAAWLQEYPGVNITIAGNCDERGTREYNLALGARRAEAAKQYLVSRGVDGRRIQTVSYGKERPIDPRSTEDAWSLNRNATSAIINIGS